MTQSTASNGKTRKQAKAKTNSKTKTKSGSKGRKTGKVVKTRKAKAPATIEDAYKHKTHHQHILDIPDTYIGSTKSSDATMFVLNPDYDEEEESMPLIIESEIKYNPGFFKIFDEIIVNARDHSVKDKTCKNIRITLDRETGRITVWNDGNGIPVAYHKGEKMYLPEMLFGHLLTSGNYDQEGKTVGGKNGYGGKLCLKKGTLVPTFSGKIKKVETIKKGEKLIGDDGTSRTVIGRKTGNGRLFEISQQRCDPYVVNEDHILCLRMPDHKVIFWSATEKSWTMLWLDRASQSIKKKSIRVYPKEKIECSECGTELSTHLKRHYTRCHPGIAVPAKPRKLPTLEAPDTKEVKDALAEMEEFAATISDDNTLDISVKDYQKLNTTTKKRLSGYVGDCVQWPEQEVELDPYVLGLWLGDGFKPGNGFAINADEDPEILEYLREWGVDNDVSIKQTTKNPYYYGISSRSKSGVAPLKKQLSKYNLVNNKRIPKEYLINSRDVRMKVLAGLIDSDGHVSRNGTRISIAQGMNHKRLVDDIVFLAKSLGLMCCPQNIQTQWSYNGEIRRGEGISLNISGEGAQDIPTKVARKKCDSPVKRNTTGTGCLTITEVDAGDFVGLAIDGNQRFVLSDFTVTHNCNIYSKEFVIHTIGYNNLKKTKTSKKVEYRQVYTNNMKTIHNPVVNGQEVDVAKVKPQIEKNGDLSILKRHIPQSTRTFTEFSYLPDYERFGMTGLTNDMYNLLVKRCYDIAACTISAGVKIFVNGEEVKCRDFNAYVRMYYAKKTEDGKNNPIKVVHEKVNSRWEIAAGFSRDTNEGDRYISFVNGITTPHGGYHLDHVVNNIAKKVVTFITSQKDYKELKIDTKTVKQYLTFFVNAVVEDPDFGSQSKEKLDSKMADWCIHKPKCPDVRCDFSEEFIEKLCNTGLMKAVVEMSEFKQSKELTKGEKGKVGRLTDIPKLIDADQAGKRNSAKASLFLTEGDSAKAFAVSGLGVIGSKFYGVFPLRGKLLNVRNASIKQIMKCAEFKNLKAILGLRQGKKYNSVSELRYGSIIILTDQDPDGSHIKGLVINMFEYFWPELLQMDGFIKGYNTYIVKAWKKTDKKKKNVKMFYTIPEFEAWKEKNDMTKWTYKYYKGLGTSDEKEARESFQDFENNLVAFKWEDPNDAEQIDAEEAARLKAKLEAKSEVKVEKTSKDGSGESGAESNEEDADTDETQIEETGPDTDELEDSEPEEDDEFAYVKSRSHVAIVKAFDENKSNLRKEWLKEYKPEDAIQYRKGMGHITYSEFIDKDLRIFSTEDNIRSICSMIDGLKPSQRMILYGCFKRGRNSGESKVAQLGAYVAEHADYHHGENSLFGAIIGMAQNFPGSNNINLLQPIGNFGYRRQGGKEAASPRYIFTALSPITNTIFRPEDDEILDYRDADGKTVEPVNYEPILPMVLVNGGEGIGTGYGFKVPPYNPKDIILNLKRLIKGQEPMEMVPWYNGFKNNEGTRVLGPNKYEFNGLYEINGKDIHISEIPIYNGWIEPYEQKMMDKLSIAKDDGKKVTNIVNNVMNNAIDMTLTFRGNELQTLYKRHGVEKFLNMRKKMSYNSMYLFDENQVIRKYDGASDILRQFYTHRLEVYNVRKAYWLKKLENDLNIYKYKVKFIKEFLADTIQVARVSSTRVIEQFEEPDETEPFGTRYPRLSNDHRKPESERSYRYLTDMSILSLTTDKLAELERKMKECQAEYDDYLQTPVEDIWMRELDEFSKAYAQFLKDWKEDNEHNNYADPNAKGKGKKRPARAKAATKGKSKSTSKSGTSKSSTSTTKSSDAQRAGAKKSPAKAKGKTGPRRARVTKAKAAGQTITTGKAGSKKASA